MKHSGIFLLYRAFFMTRKERTDNHFQVSRFCDFSALSTRASKLCQRKEIRSIS